MPHLRPELTIIALSLWLIVFLGLICVVFSLISMWKENRLAGRLGASSGSLAIVGSCAVIAILAGYVQKAKSNPKHAAMKVFPLFLGSDNVITR